MKQMEFTLSNQAYIEMNQLFKLLNLVQSGGEAKIRIQEGEAFVNGQLETRVRKKLVKNDRIEFDGHSISIL